MRIFGLVFLMIFTFVAAPGFSQGVDQLVTEDSGGLVGGMSDLGIYKTIKSGPEEVTGNPFLYENWGKNGVVYSEGARHPISNLNYNMYSDEVVELKSKNEVFIFDKAAIDSLEISGRKFNKLNGSFYETLSSGKNLGLLKRYTTRVQKGQFNPTDGTTTPSRLVQMDDYYTVRDGRIEKFKPSKGKITELFSDKQSEIKKLIKDEKLSYKDEQDLKRIFDYYNQL